MSLEDLKTLTDAFGPGGGLIVALGLLAVGVVLPVLRRERIASKADQHDLVTDREMVIFVAETRAQNADFERRIARIERKVGE